MNNIRTLPAALVLLAAACVTPEAQQPAEPYTGFHLDPNDGPPEAWTPPVAAKWTQEFMQKSALLADFVTIEGPKGLLAHAASARNDAYFERTVKTLPEGFVQEMTVKTDSAPPISAQLDGMQIKVLKRLRIIEKPGNVAVVVTARGGAYWTTPNGAKKSGDQLRFVGEVER
jgi:hypothetical protein